MKNSTLYTITFLLAVWIILDVNLIYRVKNYQINSKNMSESEMEMKIYKDPNINCNINPICNITIKGLMTNPIDFYIHHSLAIQFNKGLNLKEIDKKIPSASIADVISMIHVIVGLIGCAYISSDKLKNRRIGVLIFEFAIFLDCLDGVVARAVKNEFREKSDSASVGYVIDGFCDAVVIVFLILAIKEHLYQQKSLPYLAKDSMAMEIPAVLLYFVINITFSAFFWNLFLIHFEPLVDKSGGEFLRSGSFLIVSYFWKVCSSYSILHMTMMAIYYDKLWAFLKKSVLFIMTLIFAASIVGEYILISY